MDNINDIKIIERKKFSQKEYEDKLTGNNILESYLDDITYTFRHYANKVAPPNKEQMCMLWYIFLSQFFKNDFLITLGPDNLTPRFSGILLQASRTGKNYSSDVIYDISTYTNIMKQEKITSFTENAIIGQVINANVDYNDKKGVIWDQDKDARKPFREGLMEIADIIIIEEGKGLFVGGFKDNLTRYLQEMTDEKGEVNIGRGAGFFKRHTSCSLMITSVPFGSNDIEKIIDDGFFQRFMLMYKIFSEKDIKEFKLMKAKKELINSHDFELHKDDFIKEGRISEEETQLYKLSSQDNEAYKKMFARELNKKRDKVLKKFEKDMIDGKIVLHFGAMGTIAMNNKINLLIAKYKKEMFGNAVDKIDSFENIMKHITTKISAINCILNERKEIQSRDVEIGLKYAEIHFESIIKLLSSLENKENKENLMLARIVGNTWKNEDRAIRTILSYKKQDGHNASMKLNELVKKNYLENFEDERTGEMKYKCRDDIYELALSDDDFNDIINQKSKAIKIYNNEPLIQLLVKYFKYIENTKTQLSQEHLKTFVKIFYKNTNDRYDYNLNDKLRRNHILPKNKDKWFLYDEIDNHIMDIQFSALEEETFQYIQSFQKYSKKINKIIITYKDEWEYQGWENDFDNLSGSEKADARKTIENAKKIANLKIQDLYLQYNIAKIPSLIKKTLGEENLNHLEIVYQIK